MKEQELLIEGASRMGISLNEKQVEQFSVFYRLLIEWNEKMNLTAITEEKDVIIKHFLDSLSGVSFLAGLPDLSIADIGTGAGFPGIPLAIAFPEVPFVLMDSLQKRIGFLQESADQMGLKNVQLIHGRAEELAHKEEYREQFRAVVARAVANLPVLLEYCMGYVQPEGLFLAYKGPSLEEELEHSSHALTVLKGEVESASSVQIPFSDYAHTLAVIRKTGSMGKAYPRSQGKIKKAPL